MLRRILVAIVVIIIAVVVLLPADRHQHRTKHSKHYHQGNGNKRTLPNCPTTRATKMKSLQAETKLREQSS